MKQNDWRLATADCRFTNETIGDCRLQIADSRIVDCRGTIGVTIRCSNRHSSIDNRWTLQSAVSNRQSPSFITCRAGLQTRLILGGPEGRLILGGPEGPPYKSNSRLPTADCRFTNCRFTDCRLSSHDWRHDSVFQSPFVNRQSLDSSICSLQSTIALVHNL